MPNKKSMTASEALAALASDPDYKQRIATDTAKRQAIQQELFRNIEPLRIELEKLGIQINSPWDLVGRLSSCPEAVPVLLEHLKFSYLDRNREGIARALATPIASSGWEALKSEYERADPNSGYKSGLADALSQTATEEVLGDVISFAKDPANGTSRLLLLARIAESNSPSAVRTLEELRSDPVLSKEIASMLDG